MWHRFVQNHPGQSVAPRGGERNVSSPNTPRAKLRPPIIRSSLDLFWPPALLPHPTTSVTINQNHCSQQISNLASATTHFLIQRPPMIMFDGNLLLAFVVCGLEPVRSKAICVEQPPEWTKSRTVCQNQTTSHNICRPTNVPHHIVIISTLQINLAILLGLSQQCSRPPFPHHSMSNPWAVALAAGRPKWSQIF